MKKTLTLFCYDCDLEYTVKFSSDDTKATPDCCPFCGSSVDTEDGSGEDEGDGAEELNFD